MCCKHIHYDELDIFPSSKIVFFLATTMKYLHYFIFQYLICTNIFRGRNTIAFIFENHSRKIRVTIKQFFIMKYRDFENNFSYVFILMFIFVYFFLKKENTPVFSDSRP